MLIWEIRRYDCQVILLRRTADMQGASSVAKAQYQTTVSSRVFWIILDHIALCNRLADFQRAYHPIGPEHLPQRMGQKQHFPLCCRPNPIQDVSASVHARILQEKSPRLNHV